MNLLLFQNKIEFNTKIDTAIKICETSTPNEKPIKATKSTPSENDIWLKKLAKPKPWIKPKNSAIRTVK